MTVVARRADVTYGNMTTPIRALRGGDADAIGFARKSGDY
jgi:hypothetical protein